MMLPPAEDVSMSTITGVSGVTSATSRADGASCVDDLSNEVKATENGVGTTTTTTTTTTTIALQMITTTTNRTNHLKEAMYSSSPPQMEKISDQVN